jgi:uncharacterized RDD family membrane protein YckC
MWIAGFWRRLAALVVDLLILGALGLALGLFLEDVFAALAPWGRALGFSIALLYFGLMNSALAGGQTPGKRVLRLQVVDVNNAPISIGRSMLRYSIIATPFFLNGAPFDIDVFDSPLAYPLSIVLFGGLFSVAYLYVFNRTTRQSLHDLCVGTYVVNANAEIQPVAKVWTLHLVVVGLIFLVSACMPLLARQVAQVEPFAGMKEVQAALSERADITYATALTGTSMFSSSGKPAQTKTFVSSQVFLETDDINDAELAQNLASVVVASYPAALAKDEVRITLSYGYDIGIASQWNKREYVFTPLQAIGLH